MLKVRDGKQMSDDRTVSKFGSAVIAFGENTMRTTATMSLWLSLMP
jgi:hypothetical protein